MSNQQQSSKKLTILGGRIQCNQCQATSKRSGQQCRSPAMKGKRVCKLHGGRSEGARTEIGRQRCAEAKTIHGNETGRMRRERSLALARLTQLDAIARAMNMLTGPRLLGPKPKSIDAEVTALSELLKCVKNIRA